MLDLVLEVAVRGRHHAGIERDLLVSADRTHRALLQHAQELGLHLHRHLADLVEHDRARACLEEQPLARDLRIRERAADMAKQLALEQIRRHRAAIDRDKRLATTRGRERVKRPGNELLAGSGLAGHEHRRVVAGDAADHVPQLAHRGRITEDPVDRPVDDLFDREPLHLAGEREVLHRAIDRQLQRIGLHGLRDEVVRPRAHRCDRDVEPAVPGEHQRRDIGVAREQLLTQLDARHARHLHVRHDHVDAIPSEVLERGRSRQDCFARVAPLPQHIAEQERGVLFVVDNEDPCGAATGLGHGYVTILA